MRWLSCLLRPLGEPRPAFRKLTGLLRMNRKLQKKVLVYPTAIFKRTRFQAQNKTHAILAACCTLPQCNLPTKAGDRGLQTPQHFSHVRLPLIIHILQGILVLAVCNTLITVRVCR
jgi:hypothetical protein